MESEILTRYASILRITRTNLGITLSPIIAVKPCVFNAVYTIFTNDIGCCDIFFCNKVTQH